MAGPSHNFLIAAMFFFQLIISLYSEPENHRHIKGKLFAHAFYFIFIFQKISRKQIDFLLYLSFLVEPGFVYLMWVSKSWLVLTCTIIGFGSFCFLVYLLQIKDFPKPTGRFIVAYKDIFIEKVGEVAVFYPTDQLSRDVPWLSSQHQKKVLLDGAFYYSFPWIVQKLLILSLGYLDSIPMNVQKDARLAENVTSLNVLVFSHGIGGDRHAYSIYLKELASHGFVVLTCDHPEKIIIVQNLYGKDLQKFVPTIKEVRGSQLETRRESVSRILDYVCNPKQIETLFGREVPVNYENLMVGGHSFGGVTAVYTALTDKRVKGGVLTLDPYIFPMPDEFLGKDLNLPLLVINSETFDGKIKYAENMQRINKLTSRNSKREQTVNLICRNSDHLHQCDMVFLFSKVMKTLGFINKKVDIMTIADANCQLLRFFAEDIVTKGGDAQNLIKKINDYSYNGTLGEKLFAFQ